ncbi:ipa protein [Colletotrichum musicola]|uniref:Ipa protein n=1 Tax=Colletotrichum musicola TaxID=2175873 RepID=A0A8H6KBI7_9PEZI|nr:ipa protein [Colletotrichum musicola]
MQGPPHQSGEAVRVLHADLAQRWERHGPTVEGYWRSFDQQQRTRCLEVGGDGLKQPTDPSLGDLYKFAPE